MAPTGKAVAVKALVEEFTFDHDTKGAVQYKQDNTGTERPSIGSIYLTKPAAIAIGVKRRIRVTVEAID